MLVAVLGYALAGTGTYGLAYGAIQRDPQHVAWRPEADRVAMSLAVVWPITWTAVAVRSAVRIVRRASA